MKSQEVKYIEAALGIKILKNALVITGVLMFIPSFHITFQGAIAILMVLYGIQLDEGA